MLPAASDTTTREGVRPVGHTGRVDAQRPGGKLRARDDAREVARLGFVASVAPPSLRTIAVWIPDGSLALNVTGSTPADHAATPQAPRRARDHGGSRLRERDLGRVEIRLRGVLRAAPGGATTSASGDDVALDPEEQAAGVEAGERGRRWFGIEQYERRSKRRRDHALLQRRATRLEEPRAKVRVAVRP